MKHFLFMSIATLLPLICVCPKAVAQSPTPTPAAEDAVRIPTEEVHLTLSVEGPIRGFLPKLRAGDFTIFEDGIPQTVTSMRNLRASALLLIDSGAALTFAKDREMLDVAAQFFIANLPEESSFSVMQYNERVETLVPWTSDKDAAFASMSGAVHSGRRSMLKEGLEFAHASLITRPKENRHLVLITDGLDRSVAMAATAFKDLETSNVVVHIISLTKMEQDGAKEAAKVVRINTRTARPRVPKEIFDEMVNGLPVSAKHKEFLKMQNEARQMVIIDLDGERRKMLRARRDAWRRAEIQLGEASINSGGELRTPMDASEVLTAAADIGHSIGSNYDVTYAPSRPISNEPEKKDRAISVVSRSEALKLRTRKTVAPKR